MKEAIPQDHKSFFDSQVLGHPAGLFVLFFTEMWERFSFYGMRILLINFLTMAVIGSNPGWAWTAENAGALFGTYAGLLYLTPIVGGLIADRLTGYRVAVVIGCIIMTLGHASMALETEFSLYAGLALLVIGTGFFKPNITSVISEMYTYLPEKKDGAYTIFYMGVNAGAFFGMMLCGYLAEKVGWSWGFGLAGIFMLLGMLQFWLAGPLFGKIGGKPNKGVDPNEKVEEELTDEVTGKIIPNKSTKNPFTILDKILILITSVIGLLYLINDPVSKIGGIHLLPEEFLLNQETIGGPLVITIIGLILFIYLIVTRIVRYERVIRDRMIAVIIFAIFTVFFFVSFEQGATSLVLFARDYTQRTFVGAGAQIYLIVNSLLTIIPLMIITWVLYLLFKKTFKRIALSNIILGISFLGVWGVVIWMLKHDLDSQAYEVSYQQAYVNQVDEHGNPIMDENGAAVMHWTPVHASMDIASENIRDTTITIASQESLQAGNTIHLHEELGNIVYLNDERLEKVESLYAKHGEPSEVITATISKHVGNKIEITTSWFSILNSFFIIAFASFFSKWWDSKYNPSAAMKYSLGLILMSIGFAILAYGSSIIPQGAAAGAVRVSIIWLILAYLFHTLGELCLSPVGLSYVSKLVPPRMIAFMFGMWYLAIAIGNKLAGSMGGMIDSISAKHSMSYFFLIFTFVPLIAGVLIALLNPIIKKLMHGVK